MRNAFSSHPYFCFIGQFRNHTFNDSVAKHMRLTFSPAAGWDTLSAATDVSREADITRVKYYRNFVYGHAECASVDD